MYDPQQQPQPAPQVGPPAPGGGPAPAPGGGAPQQMHPEIAKNLDPNDPVQGYLLQNINKLTPQDVDVMRKAYAAFPGLAAIDSKIAPCVAFVFQKLASGQGGAPQPGAGPAPEPMPQGGGAPPPPPDGGLQRPATALGRMQA